MNEREFKDVIGRLTSGVAVISTRSAGVDFATTASAVTSLSAQPPMLLVCMHRGSETGCAITAAGRFAVNILGEDQADLARRFATKGGDKFAGVEIERMAYGLPGIAGAIAQLVCRVAETASAGTHHVFLSAVDHGCARDGDPLTYYRGRFGRFTAEPEPTSPGQSLLGARAWASPLPAHSQSPARW